MIKTKSSSVNISNLNQNLLNFIEDMSNMFNGIVITSGNDSIHSLNSRHYINKAIDVGAFSSEKQAYASFKKYVKENDKLLKDKYGIEDIIDEVTHIHIEMPLTDVETKEIFKKNVNYSVIGGLLIGITAYIYYLMKKFKKI